MNIEINLEPHQKMWLTADTHFGHQNIIKYCGRPWATAEEMNYGLMERWNTVVRPWDVVFHLGDFLFKSVFKIDYFCNALNGKIYILPGNHDHFADLDYTGFEFVVKSDSYQPNVDLRVNGVHSVLCHYPMVSWGSQSENVPHFFGHIHSGPVKKVKFTENSWDVGVDNNQYFPVQYERAIELAAKGN